MEWTFDFESLFIAFLLPCFLTFLLSSFRFHSLLPSISKGTLVFQHVLLFLFFFYFAIGLGGSDSGGSIEQPIMDREVISIDSSSLEDTHRDASDSESSY